MTFFYIGGEVMHVLQAKLHIRQRVQIMSGQTLPLDRIFLLQNPLAESRIQYTLSQREIQWIAISTTYWQGPPEILDAVVFHEISNMYVADQFKFWLDTLEAKLLSRFRWAMARQCIRAVFEGLLGGKNRILARKVKADSYAITWMLDNGFAPDAYIEFLEEEWNAAKTGFTWPRRTWQMNIIARRINNVRMLLTL